MKIFHLWFGACLASAVFSCALEIGGWGSSHPKIWVEETETLEISPTGLQGVSVQTHNGNLSIQASPNDSDPILVTIKKRAGGADETDAQECLQAIHIINKKGENIQNLGWEWDPSKRKTWSAKVSFEITQPEHFSCEAKTHNGPILVKGINGNCQVRSHNGKIEVEAGSKKLSAETHNAAIHFKGSPSQLKLITHNGPISAILDTVGVVNGTIVTHNGSIGLSIRDAASTKLECSTHNGRISTKKNFSDLTTGKHFLVGKLGEAGGNLKVETHNGSISVK